MNLDFAYNKWKARLASWQLLRLAISCDVASRNLGQAFLSVSDVTRPLNFDDVQGSAKEWSLGCMKCAPDSKRMLESRNLGSII